MKQKMKKEALKQSKAKSKIEEERKPVEQKREVERKIHSNEDDLLVIKRVVRSEGEKAPLTTSKRQLKKIKPDGHFEGKNKVYFDEEGQKLSADEYRRNQKLKANKEEVNYNRFQVLEDRMEDHKESDEEVERVRRKDKRRRK